jgi:hypothetical protein
MALSPDSVSPASGVDFRPVAPAVSAGKAAVLFRFGTGCAGDCHDCTFAAVYDFDTAEAFERH